MKIGRNLVFKDNTGKWIVATEKKMENATEQICESIKNLALILAPELTGDLKTSGRVEKIGDTSHKVTFGGVANGVNVPYARMRHYENKKNPQTLKYLERAGNQVTKKSIKGFLE